MNLTNNQKQTIMTYSIEDKKQNTNTSFENQSNVRSFLNQFSSKMNAYALQLTKNEFEANDLFQDTVLRIIVNSEKFTLDTNFKALTMTIMRNLFIKNYRKTKQIQINPSLSNQVLAQV